MGKQLKQWRRRKDGSRTLDQVEARRDNALVIHYSCESFYDLPDGRTPRITSIAIRNFSTGQTVSFSIHKCAEQRGVAQKDIDGEYNDLELQMLDEYFDFIRSRHGYFFLHWNMRDINYGFQAIEHRYAVLHGDPFVIEDTRKIDLARLLIAIYGVNYIGHKPSGRLHNLVEHNKITDKDLLTGAEEADAFENKNFVKLHQSTLRKVDAMANILERAMDGTLKTRASWWEMHGLHPAIIVELVREHWVWSLVGAILAVLGALSTLGLL